MTYAREELEQIATSVPFWWHSIDLGQKVITDGYKSAAGLEHELKALRLPDLTGKSVLDIGAYDGFFSFEAERRGARRVVAMDHYVWALDLSKGLARWKDSQERGVEPSADEELHFDLNELPGMLAYNTAHRALSSKVETVVQDFMEADSAKVGTFDVVLFLGVLYHMENPLEALKHVAELTSGVAIIETEAVALADYEHHALCEFFEGGELNYDPSNWWAPNEKAVAGMCRAAGFSRVETIVGSPLPTPTNKSTVAKLKSSAGFALREFGLRKKLSAVSRYRAVVHAWK